MKVHQKIILSTLTLLFAVPVFSVPQCESTTTTTTTTTTETRTVTSIVPPRIVFILDDSTSIFSWEHESMKRSVQRIADEIEKKYPNAEFAWLQYGMPDNPAGGGLTDPRTGSYEEVSDGYVTNPDITFGRVDRLVTDQLPDSIKQMRDDGIFADGGKYANPDMFFIFTDAHRDAFPPTDRCCSVLRNTRSSNEYSSDAADDYGEYQELAKLASGGSVSLYHILPPEDGDPNGEWQKSPQTAQGAGVYRSGNDFNVSAVDIYHIVNSFVAGIDLKEITEEVEVEVITEVPASGEVFEGETIEISLPDDSQLKTSDMLFVPSKSITPSEGHLRAYEINDDGSPSNVVRWDATAKMNADNRANGLYSNENGGLRRFKDLNNDAFNDNSADDIIAYTINPSTDGGTFLAGRKNGSFLGSISKGNDIAIFDNELMVSSYLSDQNYQNYYTSTIQSRDRAVLVTSDDGFLYAFDHDSGDFKWGWIPRSLVSELKDYGTFQSKRLMNGHIDIIDLKDDSGNYGSYVVGSYNKGLGHYVLKIAKNGTLDGLIWDEDVSGNYDTASDNGKMEFFRDANGMVYGINVVTKDDGNSRVYIRSLVDDNTNLEFDLNYKVTSTAFVMQDYGKRKAPAAKTLYLGTSTGDIHSALLLSDGALRGEAAIESDLKSAKVADVGVTDAVLHIDASQSVKDNKYYLVAQTHSRLTVSRYEQSSGVYSWKKAWTSYATGAGSWNGDSYTADTSGVPTKKDGFNVIPPANGIQSLPEDATIDAEVTIVGDAIILPISAIDNSSTECYGKAYYYLYSLSHGNFPSKTFHKTDGTPLETNIALGYGEAKKVNISVLSGTEDLIAYGVSDKNVDLEAGISTSFIVKDPVPSGVRAWREIGR